MRSPGTMIFTKNYVLESCTIQHFKQRRVLGVEHTFILKDTGKGEPPSVSDMVRTYVPSGYIQLQKEVRVIGVHEVMYLITVKYPRGYPRRGKSIK